MEADREKQKKEQEAMRARIRRFDKEYISYTDSMYKMMAYFMEAIAVIVMNLPCQEFTKNPQMLFFVGILLPYPVLLYLQPYQNLRENTKVCSLYEKIKYAPVDQKALRRVRVEYLLRFLGKTFPFALGAQIFWTLVGYKKITIVNLLYVILAAGVWPFLVNFALICQNTKQKN